MSGHGPDTVACRLFPLGDALGTGALGTGALGAKSPPPGVRAGDNGGAASGKLTIRLIVLSQLLMMCVLAVATLSLVFAARGVQYTLDVTMASPYVQEASNHTMGIVRAADSSMNAVDELMQQTRALAATSVPRLIESLNETVATFTRLQQLARHPTLTVAMG